MSEALQTIYGAAQATGKSEPSPLEAPGALSGALDNFDVSIVKEAIVLWLFLSRLYLYDEMLAPLATLNSEG